MITNIALENFKCFRQVSINPKRLTVLIGPNGTGKSSVLQVLVLIKQSMGTDKLNYEGEYISLGGPDDLIPNFIPEPSLAYLQLRTENESKANSENDKSIFAAEFSTDLRLYPPGEHGGPIQTGVTNRLTPIGQVLSKLAFVPAIRGFLRSDYLLGDEQTRGYSLGKGHSAMEEQLATNLVYSGPLEGLSRLMETVTGTGLRADMVKGRRVQVKSMTPSGAVNIVSEGFGTNALIQLLLQLITAENKSTVLIEEPEIHLHPKAQADLAEVLAETAKAEDKQIIMTTHSEHIAGRLLTLVAERKLTTEELAIYSFEKDEKGECSATELEITELGQTSGGLTGFFDTNLAEMDRYVKALQNRS